jgi:hypothetical protein
MAKERLGVGKEKSLAESCSTSQQQQQNGRKFHSKKAKQKRGAADNNR